MILENNIINDDCYNILPKIPDNSIDLIVIDPPYIDVVNAEWDKKEQVTLELSKELFRILKPTGSLYVWCIIGEKSQPLIRWFSIFNQHWYFKDLITWKKQRGSGARKGWLCTREDIMWYVKDNSKFIWREENQYSQIIRGNIGFYGRETKSKYKRFSVVWTDIKEESFNTTKSFIQRSWRKHLTPKPLKALRRIIKAHTYKGDIVADFFMGSGATMAAAIQTDRKYFGTEINKEYYESIQERIKFERENKNE